MIILGCGYFGSKLKAALETDGLRVLGVRRRPALDASWRALDLDTSEAWLTLADEPVQRGTLWVGIMTPDARTPEAYRQRYLSVAKRMVPLANRQGLDGPLLWVGSTAVFGAHQGICSERTVPEPDQWRGEILREAELAIFEASAPYLLRFTGLYDGSSRERLTDPGVRASLAADGVSNRMHREDATAWLIAYAQGLLRGQPMPRVIHGVDRLPLAYATIFRWLEDPTTPLVPASKGRRVTTDYSDYMPPHRYPSIREGLATTP